MAVNWFFSGSYWKGNRNSEQHALIKIISILLKKYLRMGFLDLIAICPQGNYHLQRTGMRVSAKRVGWLQHCRRFEHKSDCVKGLNAIIIEKMHSNEHIKVSWNLFAMSFWFMLRSKYQFPDVLGFIAKYQWILINLCIWPLFFHLHWSIENIQKMHFLSQRNFFEFANCFLHIYLKNYLAKKIKLCLIMFTFIHIFGHNFLVEIRSANFGCGWI